MPYFALCPIESNLPSPLQIRFFMGLRAANIFSLQRPQQVRTVGNKNFFWCLKNVLAVQQQTPMCLNISRTLLIDAPATRVAKLSKMLPAGICPRTNGWLLHVNAPLHFLQAWVTFTIVPYFKSPSVGFFSPHLKQNKENSATNIDWNTMNLGSSWMGIFSSMLQEIGDNNELTE